MSQSEFLANSIASRRSVGIGEASPIPTDLRDAIELARNSDWLKNVIGTDLYEIALQQSERELDFFNQQVTPFELERYRDVF